MTFLRCLRGPIGRNVCEIAGRRAAALGAAAMLASAPAAHADGGGSDTVYVGVAYLQAHSSLTDLSGMNMPPGLNLNVGNAATLGLGFVHDFNSHWSGELALGYPPRVRTDASGAAWRGVGVPQGMGITDVRVQSPTVFVNYHPFGVHHRIDPYIGLGVNYTRFTDTMALNSLQHAIGPTQIHLSDSWGAAAHVGLQYHFDRRWSLVSSIAVADVQSNLTATTFLRGNSSIVVMQGRTHINFHPVIYTVAIGYSY